ncbi:T9SS type A sorting domain-containing protein [Dyadobacter crusticola]|uniref:T9SS type A sorting domain-containing protein n=1 Tax=Dyadobacter crusticola TaxID=292407 RepID=UPI0004E10692|nr:T9SS type A sorting domain-containing protein [Dyadobacter crusticola]
MKKILQLIASIIILHSAQPSLAQVVVSFPAERAVFQRNNADEASVYIGGYLTKSYQQIEARFVPWIAGEGEAAPAGGGWTIIDNTIEAGHFYGSMNVKGGWYRLEVRAVKAGSEPVVTTVQHVGVGEVFVVAGQSNATGGDSNPNGPGAAHDQVNSVDYQNLNAGSITPYPSLELPCPEFVQLGANVKTAPFGNYAWCWGSFGDKIYEKFRVPVMIFNAGWSSTGVENWKQSIDPNTSPVSAFGYTFPAGMPFGHLRIALNYYIAQLGVRAVLWHQGETDNYLEQPGDNTYSRYISNLWEVISASRSLTGKSNLAWIVARASRFTVGGTSRVSANVINAQNELVNNDGTYPHVYPGPETDPYYDTNYRSDEIHFRGDGVTMSPDGQVYSGLIHLAGFWSDKITPEFLAQSEPCTATPPPAVSAAYNSGSSQITFTGPATQAGSQYQWFGSNCNQIENTSQQWTVGPGVYRLKIVDANRNTILSPQLSVTGFLLPVTWKSFTAKSNNNGRVMVEWATSAEVRASHFEVERSTNATSFEIIKSVAAAGNTHHSTTYQFEDEFLLPGTYYYRIKQVDDNGDFEHTRIIPVQIDGSETVSAFPNPVMDQLNIRSQLALENVELINAAGRSVFKSATTSKSMEVDMRKMPGGIYTIVVGTKSIRIVR